MHALSAMRLATYGPCPGVCQRADAEKPNRNRAATSASTVRSSSIIPRIARLDLRPDAAALEPMDLLSQSAGTAMPQMGAELRLPRSLSSRAELALFRPQAGFPPRHLRPCLRPHGRRSHTLWLRFAHPARSQHAVVRDQLLDEQFIDLIVSDRPHRSSASRLSATRSR